MFSIASPVFLLAIKSPVFLLAIKSEKSEFSSETWNLMASEKSAPEKLEDSGCDMRPSARGTG
jgi:hypothetical protein